jgi:hypothetical protein
MLHSKYKLLPLNNSNQHGINIEKEILPSGNTPFHDPPKALRGSLI